jgi:hypothetical protein
MSNEAALAQYQRRVDGDEFESRFIESYWIEKTEELTADIQAVLKTKGYSKDIIEFFDDICTYDGLDAIFTEHAKEAYASRNEREP